MYKSAVITMATQIWQTYDKPFYHKVDSGTQPATVHMHSSYILIQWCSISYKTKPIKSTY